MNTGSLNDLGPLLEAIADEKKSNRRLAFLFILTSAMAIIGAINSNKLACTLLWILACILLISGFKFLLDTILVKDLNNHPVIQCIRNNPETIVWVYSVVTTSQPYGVKIFDMSTMYFKLDDRTEYSIRIDGTKAFDLSKLLNPILPHTSFGYSKERDQWYMVEPNLLRINKSIEE